jgi:hypothetical protein
MAFGFSRERGTGRGYVADGSNPEFAAGTRLSRRQYDKYTERLGARRHLPGATAIRQTERELEQLRRDLAAEEIESVEFLDEQRRLLQQRRGIEATSPLLSARGAGQRRYNAALDAYVKQQAHRGRRIGKRAASQSPEFKQILADLKGKPNKRNNPRIADENRFRRRKALDALGGDRYFREQYESLYGGRPGGHGMAPRGFRVAGRGGSRGASVRTARGH